MLNRLRADGRIALRRVKLGDASGRRRVTCVRSSAHGMRDGVSVGCSQRVVFPRSVPACVESVRDGGTGISVASLRRLRRRENKLIDPGAGARADKRPFAIDRVRRGSARRRVSWVEDANPTFGDGASSEVSKFRSARLELCPGLSGFGNARREPLDRRCQRGRDARMVAPLPIPSVK